MKEGSVWDFGAADLSGRKLLPPEWDAGGGGGGGDAR